MSRRRKYRRLLAAAAAAGLIAAPPASALSAGAPLPIEHAPLEQDQTAGHVRHTARAITHAPPGTPAWSATATDADAVTPVPASDQDGPQTWLILVGLTGAAVVAGGSAGAIRHHRPA